MILGANSVNLRTPESIKIGSRKVILSGNSDYDRSSKTLMALKDTSRKIISGSTSIIDCALQSHLQFGTISCKMILAATSADDRSLTPPAVRSHMAEDDLRCK